MKKILVLFTGGTIGCSSSNGIMDVDTSRKYMLIEQYQKLYNNNIQFETKQILNVLSENITANEWETIANELNSIEFSNYSGIIITHGSDTLAYTSAFVGMLFRHSSIPIILIAANKPLDENGTNGLYNFVCAVKIITDQNYCGIFTVYEDVFLSTRIIPADTCLDKFSSYGKDEFFKISDNMLEKSFQKLLNNHITLEKKVMKIYGYPDMDFSAYSIPKDCGAVLYAPYHSGTACIIDDKNRSFENLIKKCSNKNIPLYVCGIKKADKYYSTLAKMLDLGIKPIGRISEVAAYMKLLIGINQNEYSLDDFMNMNIYFENVE